MPRDSDVSEFGSTQSSASDRGAVTSASLKLLFDTNVLISLEPTAAAETEVLTGPAARLLGLCREVGFDIFAHPVSMLDLQNDKDRSRFEVRKLLLLKYPQLPTPPAPQKRLKEVLGTPDPWSNDGVDHSMIAAVYGDAVDFLVTEDRKLRGKAARLGIPDRILTIGEALSLVGDFTSRHIAPPPAVQAVRAHHIDPTDPILASFREDYPGFDDWFKKCRRQHRQAWTIDGTEGCLAGFCIVHHEDDPPRETSGKVLKICSFKVSEQYNGFRFGELLLKSVFEYAHVHHYDWLFVTIFAKHSRLIELLETFGFGRLPEETPLGEIILAKPLHPEANGVPPDDPLMFHVRYGPPGVPDHTAWYIIPIQPRFSSVLFPETAGQGSLFAGQYPFGNALRKAYLCNSPMRILSPGAVVAFYRSRENRGIVALGVVESAIRSQSIEVIARAVGKRTVYSLREIEELCRKSVLSILFRQANVLSKPIPEKELSDHLVFQRPPQSIISLQGEGLEWLKKRLHL